MVTPLRMRTPRTSQRSVPSDDHLRARRRSGDSNPHEITLSNFGDCRVCQFRHTGTLASVNAECASGTVSRRTGQRNRCHWLCLSPGQTLLNLTCASAADTPIECAGAARAIRSVAVGSKLRYAGPFERTTRHVTLSEETMIMPGTKSISESEATCSAQSQRRTIVMQAMEINTSECPRRCL